MLVRKKFCKEKEENYQLLSFIQSWTMLTNVTLRLVL